MVSSSFRPSTQILWRKDWYKINESYTPVISDAAGHTIKFTIPKFISTYFAISRDDKNQSCKARKNFDDGTNKIFDLTMFRKCSITKVYDSLHGISTDGVELSEAVEILVYCLLDGKVDQKSQFETCLYNDLLEQIKKDKVNWIKPL